jgi:hypothetical protein
VRNWFPFWIIHNKIKINVWTFEGFGFCFYLNLCTVCLRKESSSKDWISCDSCSKWFHRNCAGLSNGFTWRRFSKKNVQYICDTCKWKKTNVLIVWWPLAGFIIALAISVIWRFSCFIILSLFSVLFIFILYALHKDINM